jgi:predicted O-methyltransferase YrrM
MRQARTIFTSAGVPGAQLRLIEGDASQVLSRLNLEAYDFVLIDADTSRLLEYVELALQIVRPGGTIAVPNSFAHGKVTDPAARDEVAQNMRDLLATVADSAAIAPVLSPAGDGLLMLTRLKA